jgi:hypothetical protein
MAVGACRKAQTVRTPSAATGSREGGGESRSPRKAAAAEFTCDTVLARNKKCVKEIVAAMTEMVNWQADKALAGLSEEARAAARAKVDENIRKMIPAMRDAFVGDKFLSQCKKNWDSKKARDVEVKKQFEVCFKTADCYDYTECIMEMVRRKPK